MIERALITGLIAISLAAALSALDVASLFEIDFVPVPPCSALQDATCD